jgi:hypothetical protein
MPTHDDEMTIFIISIVAAVVVGICIGVIGMRIVRMRSTRRSEKASTGFSTNDSIRRKNSRQLVNDTDVEMSASKPMSSSSFRNGDPASNSLPPGWVEKVSSTHGKTYYYNTTTGESAWETPTMT